jgi:hypothetical protein
MTEGVQHACSESGDVVQAVWPARQRRVADPRDVEGKELAPGQSSCDRIEKLDVAADAVEE